METTTVQRRAGDEPAAFIDKELVLAVTPSLTCFQAEGVIGTKVPSDNTVLSQVLFARILLDTLRGWSVGPSGQAVIQLPEEANTLVLPGLGKRTKDPKDYCNLLYRGRVRQFLRRDRVPAGGVTSVKAVVYTVAAYAANPDVLAMPGEVKRVGEMGATHVLIALLEGPAGPGDMTEDRFVANLAGGNPEFGQFSAERLKDMAMECEAFNSDYAVVADAYKEPAAGYGGGYGGSSKR